MDLTQIDDKTLQGELDRRKEERRKARVAERLEQQAIVIAHIETLLALVPKHDRTSCSDVSPVNEGRCKRCTLLHIRKYGSMDVAQLVEINIVNDEIT